MYLNSCKPIKHAHAVIASVQPVQYRVTFIIPVIEPDVELLLPL